MYQVHEDEDVHVVLFSHSLSVLTCVSLVHSFHVLRFLHRFQRCHLSDHMDVKYFTTSPASRG